MGNYEWYKSFLFSACWEFEVRWKFIIYAKKYYHEEENVLCAVCAFVV